MFWILYDLSQFRRGRRLAMNSIERSHRFPELSFGFHLRHLFVIVLALTGRPSGFSWLNRRRVWSFAVVRNPETKTKGKCFLPAMVGRW